MRNVPELQNIFSYDQIKQNNFYIQQNWKLAAPAYIATNPFSAKRLRAGHTHTHIYMHIGVTAFPSKEMIDCSKCKEVQREKWIKTHVNNIFETTYRNIVIRMSDMQ